MAAFCVGAFSFICYLILAGPTFYWLDSSELVAASWGLGVAHPPGHALPSLLARLFCYLPLGTIPFRVALASACQTAAATSLLYLLSRELIDRISAKDGVKAPRWLDALAPVCAALIAGFSYSLSFQAVRAEVYALNLLLLLTAILFLLRWERTEDRRYLYGAAFIIGLALCNHHFLVFLALPPGIFFILWRKRGKNSRQAVAGTVLFGLLGLMTLSYLPLRASQGPVANWGSPSTPSRLAWVVSAKAFQKAVTHASDKSVGQRSLGALFAVMGGVGPVAAMLGLGGLYLMWRRRETRRYAALFSGVILFNLAGPLLIGFDPFNPDAHGYLSVAVATLCPPIGAFLHLAGRILWGHNRRSGYLIGVVALGLVLYQGATQLPRSDLRNHWAAEETIRLMLNQSEDSLIFTSYYETIFNYWAMKTTADIRPDIDVVHRNFLRQPGYVEDLKRRLPNVHPLARQWAGKGRLNREDLDRLRKEREVLIEYDLNIPQKTLHRLRPAGLLMAYHERLTKNRVSKHRQTVAELYAAIDYPLEWETRRALSWWHFLWAHYACHRRYTALARFHIQSAKALSPKAQRLEWLEKQCAAVLAQ